MKKRNFKWFSGSKVTQSNNLLLKVDSTKKNLSIEFWAGNHSFYTKLRKDSDISGRVKKFISRSSFYK